MSACGAKNVHNFGQFECTINYFAVGLRPDPLGELTALPRPPTCIAVTGHCNVDGYLRRILFS